MLITIDQPDFGSAVILLAQFGVSCDALPAPNEYRIGAYLENIIIGSDPVSGNYRNPGILSDPIINLELFFSSMPDEKEVLNVTKDTIETKIIRESIGYAGLLLRELKNWDLKNMIPILASPEGLAPLCPYKWAGTLVRIPSPRELVTIFDALERTRYRLGLAGTEALLRCENQGSTMIRNWDEAFTAYKKWAFDYIKNALSEFRNDWKETKETRE